VRVQSSPSWRATTPARPRQPLTRRHESSQFEALLASSRVDVLLCHRAGREPCTQRTCRDPLFQVKLVDAGWHGRGLALPILFLETILHVGGWIVVILCDRAVYGEIVHNVTMACLHTFGGGRVVVHMRTYGIGHGLLAAQGFRG
jgi:hypothetical protein